MGTFSIGQLVGGRYRLAAPLARGGMGAVYRAIDERVGRPVALKVLLSDFGTDPLGVARFEREATAIASLQHPGIVQVLDLGREDDAPYLVMELVVGQTLSAVLTEHGKVDSMTWRGRTSSLACDAPRGPCRETAGAPWSRRARECSCRSPPRSPTRCKAVTAR